ncbi:hypothetical protein F441_10931 [Phytophthora nicotianae CJ01A1]|uniref:Uncharacterized protein n=5 Tax=Phytophthora nicotianae TaxID=4792 RepID=V9F1Q5_PHYNI|nr:hypothetical protein F443_11011 [Phytophthora nicotianae P1569]ETK84299.1 hypothetical protein L915_10727 [Phytophthora nicotianae]ETO72924.1 hypothetical protein F444_11077 [Phytophthora nicotianae P1976]ETP14084.1 hypothetical protein F441_10931 [Phytophthora nicotianae CJ01A1]ETP42151.1 hypothetical protein F442_10903 [Phytophthora nicotianae P10297]
MSGKVTEAGQPHELQEQQTQITVLQAAQLRAWVQWRKQTACLAPPYKMILMVEYDVVVVLALMVKVLLYAFTSRLN